MPGKGHCMKNPQDLKDHPPTTWQETLQVHHRHTGVSVDRLQTVSRVNPMDAQSDFDILRPCQHFKLFVMFLWHFILESLLWCGNLHCPGGSDVLRVCLIYKGSNHYQSVLPFILFYALLWISVLGTSRSIIGSICNFWCQKWKNNYCVKNWTVLDCLIVMRLASSARVCPFLSVTLSVETSWISIKLLSSILTTSL